MIPLFCMVVFGSSVNILFLPFVYIFIYLFIFFISPFDMGGKQRISLDESKRWETSSTES